MQLFRKNTKGFSLAILGLLAAICLGSNLVSAHCAMALSIESSSSPTQATTTSASNHLEGYAAELLEALSDQNRTPCDWLCDAVPSAKDYPSQSAVEAVEDLLADLKENFNCIC